MKRFFALFLFYAAVNMALFSKVKKSEFKPFITGLSIPGGIAYDKNNVLYIGEWGNRRVCSYDEKGRRTAVIGDVGDPSGIAFDDANNLYVCSYSYGVIYKIAPDGSKSVFASGFDVPAGISWIDGALYAANRDAGEIVRITNGRKKVIASGLPQPVSILKMNDGSFIVSCLSGPIHRIDADGSVSILVPDIKGSGINIAAAGSDSFYICVIDTGTVEKISLDGRRTVLASGFSTPLGLALMPEGNLIFAAWGEQAAYILEKDKL